MRQSTTLYPKVWMGVHFIRFGGGLLTTPKRNCILPTRFLSLQTPGFALYTGQAGSPIYITTSDDFGVVSVGIVVSNAVGGVLESGQAVESVVGSGRWTFTSDAAIPAGTDVNVQVVATDRPGGTAVESASKTL